MSEFMVSENAASLIREARNAKDKDELRKIAEKNGFHATDAAISSYWDIIHQNGEIEDDELDNVAGGFGCIDSLFTGNIGIATPVMLPFLKKKDGVTCPYCGRTTDAPFVKDKPSTVECPICHKEFHVENDG